MLEVEFPALWTMHGPSGSTDTCEMHRKKFEAVFGCLGFHTNAVPAPEGVACINCVRENQEKGKSL